MLLSISCVLIGSRSRQCVISPAAAVLLITPCLLKRKEEYQEYLEELESRLCCGEALSKDEAKALCVKPKLNQYTFNYALKKLKEEYPFLKEYCHSQVLQQKVMDLYEAFKKTI